jgi:uncharacterized protein (TIGR03086 family)
VDDLIELACLTAISRAVDKMLTEPFDDDMNKPTPCPGWDVGALVLHVVDLVIRMGGAAGIVVHDRAAATPQQRIAEALESVIDGWHRRGMNGELVWRDRTLSYRVAINVLALDVVVHGWDLAVALDRPFDVVDPYLDYMLHFAHDALTDDVRALSGFGQPVAGYTFGTAMLERLVAFTGRDPHHWRTAGTVEEV